MAQGDWTDPVLGRITFGEYVHAWPGLTDRPQAQNPYQYKLLMRQTPPDLADSAPRQGHLRGPDTLGFPALPGRPGPLRAPAVRVRRVRRARSRRPRRPHPLQPRPRAGPAPAKRRDYVFLTHRQVLTLADQAGPWRLLVLVLGYTGLRWGEATALRVCDIDLTAAASMSGAPSPMSAAGSSWAPRNRISPGLSRSPGSSPPSSRRPSAASTPRTRVHHARRQRHAAVQLAARHVQAWPRRAGLSDRFRIHDLRHTAASLMIQAGYPPKMLQEIMGHASITTTLDLYGHLYPGEMDRYADRLDEAEDAAEDMVRPKCGQMRTRTKPTRSLAVLPGKTWARSEGLEPPTF